MTGFNKVVLLGTIADDPELRYTQKGTAVLDLRLAVTEEYGNGREGTVFITVTVWDNDAENCVACLRKGSSLLVEGRISIEEWNDKSTGKSRSKLKVTAKKVCFIGEPALTQSAPKQPSEEILQPITCNPPGLDNMPEESNAADELGTDFGSGDDVPF